MGVAFYLWWKADKSEAKIITIRLYFVQLFLNVLWSFLFFGAESPILGLANIIALLVMIVLTMYWGAKVNRTGTMLMIPYLAWVCFATLLNGAIWWLN